MTSRITKWRFVAAALVLAGNRVHPKHRWLLDCFLPSWDGMGPALQFSQDKRSKQVRGFFCATFLKEDKEMSFLIGSFRFSYVFTQFSSSFQVETHTHTTFSLGWTFRVENCSKTCSLQPFRLAAAEIAPAKGKSASVRSGDSVRTRLELWEWWNQCETNVNSWLGLIVCHFVPWIDFTVQRVSELRGVVVRLAMLKGKNPGMLSALTIFRWTNSGKCLAVTWLCSLSQDVRRFGNFRGRCELGWSTASACWKLSSLVAKFLPFD